MSPCRSEARKRAGPAFAPGQVRQRRMDVLVSKGAVFQFAQVLVSNLAIFQFASRRGGAALLPPPFCAESS
jgi:hypothetical protein